MKPFFGWFRPRPTAPQAQRKPRDMDVVRRARDEAFGPIDDRTRAVDRQRIAEQRARDFGAGGLFGR